MAVSKKEELLKIYLKLIRAKKRTDVLSVGDVIKGGITKGLLNYHYGSLDSLEREAFKLEPELFPEGYKPGWVTDYKALVLDNYIKFRKKLGHMPSVNELTLAKAGCSPQQIQRYFGNISEIDQIARDTAPDIFPDATLSQIHAPRLKKQLDSAVRKSSHFMIVSAVTGCTANDSCLATAIKWAEKKDGYVLVLISFDSGRPKSSAGEETLDKILLEHPRIKIVTSHTKLNSNFHLSPIQVSAKQFDPVRSMEQLGRRDGSMVFASPKQRLKTIAIDTERYAHVMLTPGAITDPNYHATNIKHALRTAEIADESHIMGGLIVEIVDDEHYHPRHFQFDEKGAFIDLGIQYKPDGTTKEVNALGIMTGDYHPGDTDPVAKEATKEMCSHLKPKYLIVQDFYNGHSSNPHEEKDQVEMALKAEKGLLSIKGELELNCKELDDLSNFECKEIVVVYSNHDDFLNRYIRNGDFSKNHENKRLLAQLLLGVLDGHYPIPYAIEQLLEYKYKKKVTWLKEDENFFLAGINHIHGHIGRKGSRNPPTKSLARDYGPCNSGHTHDPEIYGPAYKAGTLTPRKLKYMKGPNSCLQANIVTYPNGSRQLLIIVDGKYCL